MRLHSPLWPASLACAARLRLVPLRTVQRAVALKLAHFPAVRDLESFDYSAQPSIDPNQIKDLDAGRWIANGDNLLMLGPPGVGNTHLAIALGR